MFPFLPALLLLWFQGSATNPGMHLYWASGQLTLVHTHLPVASQAQLEKTHAPVPLRVSKPRTPILAKASGATLPEHLELVPPCTVPEGIYLRAGPY